MKKNKTGEEKLQEAKEFLDKFEEAVKNNPNDPQLREAYIQYQKILKGAENAIIKGLIESADSPDLSDEEKKEVHACLERHSKFEN